MFDMVVGMDAGTTTIERPAAVGASWGGAVAGEVGDWESRLRELDDRIGVLSAQIHALDAELVGVLAEYDAVGGWQGRGWRSFAHYLSVRTNFAPRDAERLVSIAARVDEMPSLIAAARGGQVSMGGARVRGEGRHSRQRSEGPRRRAGLHPTSSTTGARRVPVTTPHHQRRHRR